MANEQSVKIHPTAIVSPQANLGEGVEVGPFCVIGPNVTIGAATTLGPSCLVEGPTVLGARNRIAGHASIGTAPQDLKYHGEPTELQVGDDNQIREFTTLNRGTVGGGGKTRVGSRNLLMTGVHVAHDCIVGNDAILANAATLAGHATVEDGATVGAFTGVHQFCRVGLHAFIGGYSVITRDVLPYMKTVGIRGDAKCYGPNSIGLERRGFSAERLEALNKAYRTLFRRHLRLVEAVARVREEGPLTEDVLELLAFIEASERGFIR